jgi:N-formylmaleamate deformylase
MLSWIHSRPQAQSPSCPLLRWQKITCPVLLLTGDPEKGAIVTPAGAQKAVQALPSLRLAHIPGVGHCIHREAFSASMQVVTAFLAEL